MPLLVTSQQRQRLREAEPPAIPRALAATLVANHARVLDLFRALDADRDGGISRAELRRKLEELGMQVTPAELCELFDALDPDGSGLIEFEELRQAMMHALRGIGRFDPTAPPSQSQQRRPRGVSSGGGQRGDRTSANDRMGANERMSVNGGGALSDSQRRQLQQLGQQQQQLGQQQLQQQQQWHRGEPMGSSPPQRPTRAPLLVRTPNSSGQGGESSGVAYGGNEHGGNAFGRSEYGAGGVQTPRETYPTPREQQYQTPREQTYQTPRESYQTSSDQPDPREQPYPTPREPYPRTGGSLHDASPQAPPPSQQRTPQQPLYPPQQQGYQSQQEQGFPQQQASKQTASVAAALGGDRGGALPQAVVHELQRQVAAVQVYINLHLC